MRAELRRKRDAFLGRIGTRPRVMGILNVTPDSFSDGGQFQTIDDAVDHAKRMAAEGCDIIDIGGESTRPSGAPVTAEEELGRVALVLETLAGTLDVPLSVDTSKAEVAARVADVGAVLINDVWGLQKDLGMADVVAEAETAVVIMHNRTEKDETVDIIADIRRFFDRSLGLAAKAGIPRERIILDPGIGFAKTSRQNRDAIVRLNELKDYGLSILVGVSRKGFLGRISEGEESSLAGTIAANLAAAAHGASIFRVHDVAENVAALKVFHAIRTGRSTSESWPGASGPAAS
jgi:dihydropteroate synthase